MPPTQVYLGAPHLSLNGLRCVKTAQGYASKLQGYVINNTYMGWMYENDQWHLRDREYMETYYGVGAKGGTGVHEIWDYSSNPTLTFTLHPLAINQNSISGFYGTSYPKTRDGGTYKIKHKANKGQEDAMFSVDSYKGLEKPTFYIEMADDSVISLNSGSNSNNEFYYYDEWFRTATDDACAQHDITLYKKPYVADQTMRVYSSTTTHQFYPLNVTQTVKLLQPSVYGSIGIIDNTNMEDALSGYSMISSTWQHNYSYGEIVSDTGDWFFIRILAYIDDWDSIGDISYSWNATGAKKTQFNPMSGTINSFAQVTGHGSSWENYAVGYQQVYIERGKLTAPHYDDAGLPADINIVPNGLKQDSGTWSKTITVVA
jgi:hypothetical protein